MSNKRYIGDSVYAEYDGFGIWLTTENGLPGDPSNKIYLEPTVYRDLCRFVDRIAALDTDTGTSQQPGEK